MQHKHFFDLIKFFYNVMIHDYEWSLFSTSQFHSIDSTFLCYFRYVLFIASIIMFTTLLATDVDDKSLKIVFISSMTKQRYNRSR